MRMKTMQSTIWKLCAGTLLGGSLVASSGCPNVAPELTYNDTTTPLAPQQFPDRVYVDPNIVPDGAAPLIGSVKNVLTNEYVADAALYTKGITPPVEGTSNAQGGFELQIPIGSVFYLQAYKTGYAYTYDKVDMTTPAAQYNENAYIVNQADIDAMATAFGKTQYPGCGVILGSVKEGGQYAANVDSFALQNADYEGPYYLDENNAADPAATYTSTGGRFIYFNVCDTGAQTITDGKLVSVQADGGYYSQQSLISVYQGGVTLVDLEVVNNGGPDPEPDPENVIDYATQIHPIWNKFGCAGCHNDDPGAAAYATGLFFINEDPEAVWYNLTNRPNVVNVQYPDQSYLLTYPLYEDPPNHPNASFADTNDPDYLAVLAWIEAQAPYGVNPPVLDPDPIDIYGAAQIFQNRCNGCHGDAQNGAYAALNLTLPEQELLEYLSNPQYGLLNYDYPERSKLIAYPYCGQNAAKCQDDEYWGAYAGLHPTTVFQTREDPDMVLLSTFTGLNPNDVPPPPIAFNDVHPYKYDVQEYFVRGDCVRCHSQQAGGGQQPYLMGDPYTTCNTIYNDPTLFNAANPEQSYLMDPVAEFGGDHGGGQIYQYFADGYPQYVGGWMYNDGTCPDQQIRSFATDILPLFENAANGGVLNCTGCHGAAGGDGGLNLAVTDPANPDPAEVQAIYDNIKNNLVSADYYPYDSAILQKPFQGVQLFANVGHTGDKRDVINNADYRQAFVKIITWIDQQAQP